MMLLIDYVAVSIVAALSTTGNKVSLLLIGAWCARRIAKKQAEGFIEMGSFFDFYSDILSQYPKPVLSLSGRLDGQLKFASMANHAEPEMRDVNTYAVQPVIIISRVNHAQI